MGILVTGAVAVIDNLSFHLCYFKHVSTLVGGGEVDLSVQTQIKDEELSVVEQSC